MEFRRNSDPVMPSRQNATDSKIIYPVDNRIIKAETETQIIVTETPLPPLGPKRQQEENTDALCVKRRYKPEDWINLDANTSIHMDIWETMNFHTDSRFVKEVAQKLCGTEVLKQRYLNPQTANEGKENEELRLPLTPEKYQILKGKEILMVITEMRI